MDAIQLWRWRLHMQLEPPRTREDSFAKATRAILKTNPSIGIIGLMTKLRCGYRRAEKLLKEERGY